MKKFILAFIMSFMMCAGVYAADQEVYIVQSGATADIDIILDGSGNKVGASTDKTTITGTNQDVDINFTGNLNTLTGDFINTGVATADDFKLDTDGNSNQYTIDVGGGGEAINSSIIEDRDGSSGVVSYRIGTDCVTKNTDIEVVAKVDDVDIDILANSRDTTTTQKLIKIDMAISSKDVDFDIDHAGAGIHNTDLNIDGSAAGTDYIVSQTGAQDTTVNLQSSGATSSHFNIQVSD